jgi:superfamily II DNA or RNA helicase
VVTDPSPETWIDPRELDQRPVANDELYRWQLDALVSWLRCGRRGVVEAVTGSGKTDVAIAAAGDALRRGRFVLVLVPSRVLMEQWYQRLVVAFPAARIGRLGDNARDRPQRCDILVATRHSAAAHRPVPPSGSGGLIVADECHGLGGRVLRRAMLPEYDERLGLTATLERSDDGVTDLLLPYFGGVCHRYGFGQAIADGVCAAPRVAFVGVALTPEEQAEYVEVEHRLVSARAHLRAIPDMPLDPFGDFVAAVAHLADRDSGRDGRAARDYLDAFSKRRAIVAETSGKYELLGELASMIADADGALIFTETVRAANHAINRLDPHVAIDLMTGSTPRHRRREILQRLRSRDLAAVAAPRVLDEGIDVPDANLGIVMSASRTRRQMVQRMGRILRRKQSGTSARFLIMFAQDTQEDPANRVDRDGFLDELERISTELRVFAADDRSQLTEFLAAPGPSNVPRPERLDHLLIGARGVMDATDDELVGRVRALAADLGVETAYALIAFARSGFADRVRAMATETLFELLPESGPHAPFVEFDVLTLPRVSVPKKPSPRLSTGQAPVEVTRTGNGWSIRCTGCGETSNSVEFRWQALDQLIACRCE